MKLFKDGVHRAAAAAATRLQHSYDVATKKGTDRYIEVLWAAACGQLLSKQFKNIRDDYSQIVQGRPGRDTVDEQGLRNHLNALCKGSHGSVLEREKVGWYQFTDPMFRSYVRMMAFNNGVDLGEESFRH